MPDVHWCSPARCPAPFSQICAIQPDVLHLVSTTMLVLCMIIHYYCLTVSIDVIAMDCIYHTYIKPWLYSAMKAYLYLVLYYYIQIKSGGKCQFLLTLFAGWFPSLLVPCCTTTSTQATTTKYHIPCWLPHIQEPARSVKGTHTTPDAAGCAVHSSSHITPLVRWLAQLQKFLHIMPSFLCFLISSKDSTPHIKLLISAQKDSM